MSPETTESICEKLQVTTGAPSGLHASKCATTSAALIQGAAIVPALLQLLHSEEESVKHAACSTLLWDLDTEDCKDAVTDKIAEAGIPALTGILESNNDKLAASACSVLCSVSEAPGHRAALVKAGALSALVALLKLKRGLGSESELDASMEAKQALKIPTRALTSCVR